MAKSDVALVTGGSGALGAAIAVELDRVGMSVAVNHHTNSVAAKSVCEQLENPALAVQADLGDWSEVSAMEERVRRELGPVAVLVNCGAIRRDGLMATQSPAEWAEVIRVNLVGTFHACRAVVPRMLKMRWGRIINVVSPAGILGNSGQTAYGASKAGVIGLTKTLAVECGRRGVTVNALSPGFMQTALTGDVPQAAVDRLLDRVPLARITTAEEVARATAFIVDSGYMTGQVISVDGGLTA
jgi:3-oxoacyl-[acyl-carrier protein] reductase